MPTLSDAQALAYTASYADLRGALGVDPDAARRHFAQFGAAEGRTISFDALRYTASNVDLIRAIGTDEAAAARHYIQFGAAEGRSTSFDGFSYLAANADLRSAFGANTIKAAQHFIEFGAAEGRNTAFDGLSYLASYADLRAAFGTDTAAATCHYVQFGAAEGRTITFDSLGYLASHADLRAAFGSDTAAATRHYVEFGARESRTITFDPVAYLLSNPDLVAAGMDAPTALRHWLRIGATEQRSVNGSFGTEQTDHGLQLSTPKLGLINQAGDRDWFQIDARAGNKVGIDLLLNGQRQGIISVFDAHGRAVTLDRDALGQSSFTATGDGTYYVVVAATGFAFGNYTLLVDQGLIPLLGTADGETLSGTAANEHLVGLAGNDILIGAAGNDLLEGGAENDRLEGGAGDDILYGDTLGNDEQGGDDYLVDTDNGNDRLYGQGGNDYLLVARQDGTASTILLDGGAGDDIIYHNTSTSLQDKVTVYGGSGDDTIQIGRVMQGTIDAGTGNDLVRVNSGNVTITLGAGRDLLEIDAAFTQSGAVTITDFKPGEDRVNLDRLLGGRLFGWDQRNNPFAGGYLSLVAQGSDTLVMIDRDGQSDAAYAATTLLVLQGVSPAALGATELGFRPDGGVTEGITLVGTAARDRLDGLAGADRLQGLAGNDDLDGRAGDDVLEGGEGFDRLEGGLGNDRLYGNNVANSGVDGADSVRDVSGGNDELYGQDGNDELYVYRVTGMIGTSVTLDGGAGDDRIEFDSQRVVDTIVVRGGSGADTISIGFAASAQIDAGAGNDTVVVDTWSSSQTITLGEGNDVLSLASRNAVYAIGNPIRVTDFTVGSDRLALSDFLGGALLNWDKTSNPFGTGHLKLVQSGTDTLLQIDRDGAGSSDYAFSTLLTLSNTTASNFTAREIGYAPPVQRAEVIGTNGDDTLSGTDGADVLRGLDGADTLSGRGGNDLLEGGSGNDRLDGGLGDDVLYGNNADNSGAEYSFSYDTLIDDQGGNDRLYGQDGSDYLSVSRYASNGNMAASTVLMDGGNGDDTIRFNADSRFLDTVTVNGGAGNDDILVGSVLRNVIDAGEGNDKIAIGMSGGNQTITLGAGSDVLTLNGQAYNYAAGNPTRITDFATGTDMLNMDQYLSNVLFNWDKASNPLGTGHIRLVQSGADTLLQIDRDGASGTGYEMSTLLTFANASAASFTAKDLGFEPNTFTSAGTSTLPDVAAWVGGTNSFDDMLLSAQQGHAMVA